MRKTIKQLKEYYCDNFAHTSQLDAIKAKTGFFDVAQKPAKKAFWLKPAFIVPTMSLAVAIPLLSVFVVAPALKPNAIPQMEKRLGKSVITMNTNPSISLTIDEKGTVNAVYGENNDGKIILLGENILNKPYEEAIAKIIDIEKECGYLVNDVSYDIKVYSESSVNENELSSSVATYFKKSEINITCQVEQSNNYETLKENLYSSETELSSFDDYYQYLYDYYQENEESLTKDYEAFNEMYNSYASQIASYKAALKETTDSYVLKTMEIIETKFDDYFNSYFKNFIENDSPYQKYFAKLVDAKSDYLINQSLEQDNSVEEKLINTYLNNLETLKNFITETLLKPRLDELTKQFQTLSSYVTDENINIDENMEEVNDNLQQMKEKFYEKQNYTNCQKRFASYLKEVKTKTIKAIKGA